MKHQEIVMIVDFGGQYAQLIARRVRECGVYCEILPYNKSAKEILAQQPKGIIFSGGPSSVNAENAPEIDPDVSKQVCRSSASATACSSWPRPWAAKFLNLKNMNTVTPISTETAAPHSSKASPKRQRYG